MALGSLKKGSLLQNTGGSGGSATEVALLSVTTAPASPFAVGSKYYNSSTKKIVTAVTADTWTGATSADAVFNVIYTYDSGYYIWDGNSLESTDLNLYEKISNKTDSYTETSPTKYPSSKALSDGLASVGSSSVVPFSVKSSNVGSNGLTDIASINEIINSGCSVTSGVATGGSGKYLQLTKTAPLNSADSWEIKTKYKYTGGGGAGKTILGSSTTVDIQVPLLIVDNSGGDNLYFLASTTGTSWDLFQQDTGWSLSSGTTYWIILSYDSVTGYKIEYSTNGTDYTTAWSSSTVTKCYCSKPFAFLNNMFNSTLYYSSGEMDLSETTITIDSAVWFSYSETLRFKIDDGTLYAPLTIVSADGTETTLTTVSDLDLSSFADGRINIFFGASGAVAYNNTIFNQTNQPTRLATNDIWFNKLDEAKKWSGSAWVATDLVFGLYIIKNGILETYGNVPLKYNGVGSLENVMYFAPEGSGTQDGSSWGNAKAFTQSNYNNMADNTAAFLLYGTYTFGATLNLAYEKVKPIFGGFTGRGFEKEQCRVKTTDNIRGSGGTTTFNSFATIFTGANVGINSTYIDNVVIYKYCLKDMQVGASINNCVITNSSVHSKSEKGAVYNNCYFLNCYCNSGYGGAIEVNGTGIIANSVFENCECTDNAGGGAAITSGGKAYNCKAINCKYTGTGENAYGGGGFAAANGGEIYNCTTEYCSSTKIAGGIYKSGGSDVVNNCSAIGCTVVEAGGGFNGDTVNCKAISCYAPIDPDVTAGTALTTSIGCFSKRPQITDNATQAVTLSTAIKNADYFYTLTLTSLAITAVDVSEYTTNIYFTTDSTFTSFTPPTGQKFIGSNSIVANKEYKIQVLNGIMEIFEIV